MEQMLKDIQLLANFHFAPWGAAKGEVWESLSNDREFTAQNTGAMIQDILLGRRIITPVEREEMLAITGKEQPC